MTESENMSLIVNDKTIPTLREKKVVEFSCPKCKKDIGIEGKRPGFGNTIECQECKNQTYFPFSEEKPWYKRWSYWVSLLVSSILSGIIGFSLGKLWK